MGKGEAVEVCNRDLSKVSDSVNQILLLSRMYFLGIICSYLDFSRNGIVHSGG